MSPTARNLVCDKIAVVIPLFMHDSVGIEAAVLRASLIEKLYTWSEQVGIHRRVIC